MLIALLLPVFLAGTLDDPIDATPAPTPPAQNELVSADFGLRVEAPDADWTFDTPRGAPGVLGAFVHKRGDQVLAIITVSADAKPQPADAAGYAKRTFETLAAPPMSFAVGKKGAIKSGEHAGFEMRFGPKDGTKRFVQRYFAAKKGMLVFGLQAPAKSFDEELPAFEKLVQGAHFQ